MLLLILQIQKHSQEDDTLAKQAANAVLSLITTVKHVILIDLDVDPYSAEDLLWAMTTRFQADQDMNLLTGQTPFLMDPSQSSGYREGAGKPNTCVKSIFDCTAPWRMAGNFKRSF